MNLLNFWPSLSSIDECIQFNAENASDEVLLAVHQQFPLAYLTVGPDGRSMSGSKTVATEENLLSYFIKHASSGSHVVPITGKSGVGKSHLIRMLEVKIRRLPDADRYLIIRIPKSASLRSVVQLILNAQPLDDEKYDAVKDAFSKAMIDDVSPDEQVIRFQAEIGIALNNHARSLKILLDSDPTNNALKESLLHALRLHSLMTDAVTVGHFQTHVLPRIIQRAVKGVNLDNDGEIDSASAKFNVNDLDLDNIDISGASNTVQYYYKNLKIFDGRGKKIAVDVLNSVVDISTNQLYKLNQSLGGMTLGEVILEIRELLLLDDRELVILVEDYFALVGIQDTLAKVLIQDGTTSDGKKYATIRSAIAVTDGFLTQNRSLATRAGREWIVEDKLDSEIETLRRTKLLVASYLNAARYGAAGLKKHYQQVFSLAESDDEAWQVPAYAECNEEEHKILRAFGYVGNIPLFPFTEAAIESLARIALLSGNSLEFNPRYVIKNIIQLILRAGRNAFIEQTFPPADFPEIKPSSDIAQWLSSLPLSEDVRKRYSRLVTIWGNNPEIRSEIGHIPREVFDAFQLPLPAIEYVPFKSVTSVKNETSGSGPVLPILASRQDLIIKEYKDSLENWVKKGTKLEQTFANEIRKALAILINQRLDWNAELRLKSGREFTHKHFSLLNSGGEGNLIEDPINVSIDYADLDGSLRSELISLLRYFVVYKDNFDYADVEDDIARIGNLADRLLPLARNSLCILEKKRNQSALLFLAANSRLLGIGKQFNTLAGTYTVLFGDFERVEKIPEEAPLVFKEWNEMQHSASRIRPKLQSIVIDAYGGFQGTGKTAYCIDIVRLFEDYLDSNEINDGYFLTKIDNDLKTTLSEFSDIKVSSKSKKFLVDAIKIQDAIMENLGLDFDKKEVVDQLKFLAKEFNDTGEWDKDKIGMRSTDFIKACDNFQGSAIKEALTILDGLNENSDDLLGKKITRLAKLQITPLIAADQFMKISINVINAANKFSSGKEILFDGVSSEEKANQIISVFDGLISNLETLKTGSY